MSKCVFWNISRCEQIICQHYKISTKVKVEINWHQFAQFLTLLPSKISDVLDKYEFSTGEKLVN